MSSPSNPVTALMPKLTAMTNDARSDREALLRIEVFGFIEKAITDLASRRRKKVTPKVKGSSGLW